MTTGLYLVIIDSVEDDNYRYNASPTLISVPNYNMVTSQYMYDLSIVMKTEATSIGQPDNPNNDNKADVPNTYDAIIRYVIVFIVALLVLVITVCYINKIRKDVKKNEKNNEKIVSVALVVALLIIPFSTLLNVKALNIETNDAGVVSNTVSSLTVTNVGKGDQLGAYKILDALYNKTSNVISYQFTQLLKISKLVKMVKILQVLL